MFLQGVGTATPPHRYTQSECWQALQSSDRLGRLNSRSQAILRKVLAGDTGIAHRHFVMSDLAQAFSIDPNTLHRRFADNAPALAAQAARHAMERAQVSTSDIDALLISTCTGYLCPGLTSYVSEQLGLDPRAALADFVGQGCGAALPNLRFAEALLGSGQARRVLSICVEVCSAAFYLDDDAGVLISACLFGDGAAAVVLGPEPGPERAVRWVRSASILNPRDRELLRFESRDGMLRNVLDKSVPLLVVEHLRQVIHDLEFDPATLGEWIVHSGGRDVLAAIQSGLGAPAENLRWSAGILRDFGNLSSPSVLFALDRALRNGGAPGTWFMAAFGAGISCHGALLEVG